MKRLLLIIFLCCLYAQPCWAKKQAQLEVNKGNRLYNEGKFTEALKSYEQALVDAPDSDVVNFNLGAALYKTKRYEQAIGHFEKSLVSEKQLLEQKASYNLGNAKYKYGITQEDTDLRQAISLLKEALRHYEHALEIDPEDEDAKYNYEFVKKELERLEKKLKQQQQKAQAQKEKQESKGEEQKQQLAQQQQPEKEKPEEKESEEQTRKQQPEQPEQAGQKEAPAQASKPEQSPEAEEQTAKPKQPGEELSPQEALMLLESYRQEDEPKGLYREKIPTTGLPEVSKDW